MQSNASCRPFTDHHELAEPAVCTLLPDDDGTERRCTASAQYIIQYDRLGYRTGIRASLLND
jgi:hypothetical protein